MEWLKLYTEAVGDKKLATLSDGQFRVWFNLLCLAGKSEKRGTVTWDDDDLLALEVANCDTDLLIGTLDRLRKLRILSGDNGAVTFCGWEKRQRRAPSDEPEATAERQRNRRQKSRQGTGNVTGRAVPVTTNGSQSSHVTSLSRDVTRCHGESRPRVEESRVEEIRNAANAATREAHEGQHGGETQAAAAVSEQKPPAAERQGDPEDDDPFDDKARAASYGIPPGKKPKARESDAEYIARAVATRPPHEAAYVDAEFAREHRYKPDGWRRSVWEAIISGATVVPIPAPTPPPAAESQQPRGMVWTREVVNARDAAELERCRRGNLDYCAEMAEKFGTEPETVEMFVRRQLAAAAAIAGSKYRRFDNLEGAARDVVETGELAKFLSWETRRADFWAPLTGAVQGMAA